MVSVPVRRELVALARKRGVSQRRACTLFDVGRSALHYRSSRGVKDAPVLTRMAELSAQYPRYGYRRIAIFLGRDGYTMSFLITPMSPLRSSAVRRRSHGRASA